MRFIYEYQGYVGLDAISKAFGVSKQTLSYRMRFQGKTLHEAIHTEKNTQARKRKSKKAEAKSGKKLASVRFPFELHPLWMLSLGINQHNGASL